MRKNLLLWVVTLFYLLCSTAMAQQPTLEWAQRFNTFGSTNDHAISVAVDEEGNSYVTGTSVRQGYYSQITTIKYAPSGEQLWVAQFQEFSNATGIAIDNAGGVYVTGESQGNFLTIRYGAATGEQTWSQHYDGPANSYDHAHAIAVDNSGGVYVTGSSTGLVSDADYATVRYDATTGEQTWVQHYDGSLNLYDVATAIAVDNAGGVYVTGSSLGTDYNSDYATIRYDASTGEQSWVRRYVGPDRGVDNAVDIAADKSGVYVTGSSGFSNYTTDYATVHYSTSGEQIWVQHYDGPVNGYEEAIAIALDNSGSVYVTGSSEGDNYNSQYATVRYDAATGEQLWVQRYEGSSYGYNSPRDIVVDNAGGVYVTGLSYGDNYNADYVTIRYNTDSGNQSWVQRYDGSSNGDDHPTAMAVGNGGVTVTGSSYDNNWSSDYATVRYDASTGEQSWVQRYDGLENSDNYPVSVAVDSEGNTFVTGTSETQAYMPQLTTVKYSPSGEQLWVVHYETYSSASGIAIDNQDNVFVTGESNGSFLTIRYSNSTGEQQWVRHYSDRESYGSRAAAITVDNSGGVYVTGNSYNSDYLRSYATVRYDANTGAQTWVQKYEGPAGSNNDATAIAVDNMGGVYVTGDSYTEESMYDYATVRYDASTGAQTWVQRYNGPSNGIDITTAIAVDNTGGVYVTGNSYSEWGWGDTSDYLTIRYDAATGAQVWEQRYDGPASGFDRALDMTVDNAGGVYVTGGSYNADLTLEYATIRYDALTGDQVWIQRYSEGYINAALAIAADNAGGVYVTGGSYREASSLDIATLRYDAATGEQSWVERYTEAGISAEVAIDMALDSRGNIIIAGYTDNPEEGIDFLTLKYSQCPILAEAELVGSTTAAVGTARSAYSLPGTGAYSFNWSITDSNNMSYTDFTGQGTEAIAVNWPSEPGFYKMTVTYGGSAGCPTKTAVMYVHIFDPEAGFVTGNGWITSPVNKEYAFMQESQRARWSFSARYMKGPENRVQGATHLMLQAGAFAFRSTSIDDRSLVITDNTAFFTGRGTASYRSNPGGFVTDPRQFGYLVAATDGQFQGNRGKDRFRLMIWVINEDGSQGAVVYDNQVACLSSGMDENMLPCSAIGQGSIVIHKPNARSMMSRNALASADIAPGLQAYPTAFHDRTTIAFSLEEDATAYTLDLYDLKGTLVQRIAAGTAETDRRYEHELQAGSLAKGLYLARLTTGSKVQTVKLVVQK